MNLQSYADAIEQPSFNAYNRRNSAHSLNRSNKNIYDNNLFSLSSSLPTRKYECNTTTEQEEVGPRHIDFNQMVMRTRDSQVIAVPLLSMVSNNSGHMLRNGKSLESTIKEKSFDHSTNNFSNTNPMIGHTDANKTQTHESSKKSLPFEQEVYQNVNYLDTDQSYDRSRYCDNTRDTFKPAQVPVYSHDQLFSKATTHKNSAKNMNKTGSVS